MAIGNPLLALHYPTDSVIRVYELIDNEFVPVGNTNGYTGSGFTQNLMWHKSSGKLIYMTRSGTNVNIIAGSVTGSGPTSIGSLPVSTNTGSPVFNTTSYNSNSSMFLPVENSNTYPSNISINIDATASRLSSYLITVANRINFTHISVSPDSNFVSMTTNNNSNNVYVSGPSTPNSSTQYPYDKGYLGFPCAVGKNTSKSFFSYDGSLLVVADLSGENVEVYKLNVTYTDTVTTNITLTKTNNIPSQLGVLQNVVSSPDKTTMAFVYLKDSIYTTYLFGKYGDYVMPLEKTFTNFGNNISFTGDGTKIIDGTTKKMLSFNGSSWVSMDSAMVNIVAGAATQTLSDHVQNQIIMSKFYDNALNNLSNGNPLDLRLLLLKDTAVFDRSQTNINQISESSIVRNGMWPVDGATISISHSGDATRYYIDAPAKSVPVVNDSIIARYALIYNKITNAPMIFYDLSTNRVFPVGSRVNFSFLNNHIVTYTE